MFMKVGGSTVVLALVLGCAGRQATSSLPTTSPISAPVTLEALAGDYALVAVDGHSLPYAARPQGASVASGSFLLNANGTFRLQTVQSPDITTSNAPAFSGTCYTEANEVKMVWDGGGLTNMSVRGDTVMLKREGALYAYVRRR